MFKAQMVRKNVELELQALVLLQHQLGLIKRNSPSTKKQHQEDGDDEIMRMVMQKSKDEYEALTAKTNNKASAESTTTMPIKRVEDLETAKKLIKSHELVDNLRQELDQQDKISNKLIRDELKSKNKNDDIERERPQSSRRAAEKDVGPSFEHKFDRMKLQEMSSKLDAATLQATGAAQSLAENFLSQGKITNLLLFKKKLDFNFLFVKLTKIITVLVF